jgi:polyvinyl alcohol dehydrogenase (cytochrome)
MKHVWLLGVALAASVLAPRSVSSAEKVAPPAAINTEYGFGRFQQLCFNCHGNPAFERAPSPAQLRAMSPEAIYASLTGGTMRPIVGEQLTDEQRRGVSESIAGRLLGTDAVGDASAMPNRCARNPALTLSPATSSWNGWSPEHDNARFQAARRSRLNAAQISRLKLKWAFGYPGGSTSAYAQPAVVSGRIFVGTDIGYVYSLDAATGCVYWSYRTKAGVRAAISLGAVSGHASTKVAAFVGDLKANIYALDARTGEPLWEAQVDANYTARVSAAPTLHDGTLYVPVSSWEEFNARTPDYPCCTSVGSVVALNVNTGQQTWKTYVIDERPRPFRKNSKGVQLWAPAGGSVWNSPTIDARRGVLYVGTGDGTTYPPASTTDSVLALDLRSGKKVWSYQVHDMDSFLVGCEPTQVRTENCPPVQGPDWDIPLSPILKSLADGRRVVVVGTKPGDVIALDPDDNGRLLWRVSVSGGPPVGTASPHYKFEAGKPPVAVGAPVENRPGLIWGGAADARNVYFGVTTGGAAALRLDTGARAWFTPLAGEAGASVDNSAPASATADAVFVEGTDGIIRALSTSDGRVLWTFATAHAFDTVNKVPARGGSISSAGATIADGMVFVPSGYAIIGTQFGNVLLAFAPE